MRKFAKLFETLDQTTKIKIKVQALAEYFDAAEDPDKLWTIALLSHRRPKRTVGSKFLRGWGAELAEISQWLFDESYHVVGDLAETIALLLPPPIQESNKSLTEWVEGIAALQNQSDVQKKVFVTDAWKQLNSVERFIFNKLITGGFRIGVSQKLMTKALSIHTGIDENVISYKITGNWTPTTTTFEKQILSDSVFDDHSKPFPFYLAYALDQEVESLGDPQDWIAERKWDGIRGQLIKRGQRIFLWSRGEELVTEQYPEFKVLETLLPDGIVMDGELLPFKHGIPMSFQDLQKRLGRKKVSKNIQEKYPVILKAYDLLEFEGRDIRETAFSERRKQLENIVQEVQMPDIVQLSEIVPFNSWETLKSIQARSREFYCEGLMLKGKKSVYKVGRKKGEWWKWKIDPLSIDAVMIYAQRGHGRRANLFSDFTFAVWDDQKLVPFAKAYSGLTDAEFNEITTFVYRNTLDRFGPVRAVRPNLVFEIAFEGIQTSNRHKSGVALRFPRISRWRKDKHPKEANTLDDLNKMLKQYG